MVFLNSFDISLCKMITHVRYYIFVYTLI